MIQSVRDKQPVYNLITNNCQTYALQLLDAIKVGGHNQFGTTLAVYERLVGSGKVIDLFPKMEGQEHEEAPPAAQDGQDTVSLAQQVMNDNTTQLDTHDEQAKQNEERGKKEKKEKKGIFSRFTRK